MDKAENSKTFLERLLASDPKSLAVHDDRTVFQNLVIELHRLMKEHDLPTRAQGHYERFQLWARRRNGTVKEIIRLTFDAALLCETIMEEDRSPSCAEILFVAEVIRRLSTAKKLYIEYWLCKAVYCFLLGQLSLEQLRAKVDELGAADATQEVRERFLTEALKRRDAGEVAQQHIDDLFLRFGSHGDHGRIRRLCGDVNGQTLKGWLLTWRCDPELNRVSLSEENDTPPTFPDVTNPESIDLSELNATKEALFARQYPGAYAAKLKLLEDQ